jgi:hypothetical protein
VADLDLHRVVRAINRQISQDFEPYWGFGGRLRVEGPAAGRIATNALREMRGDAVLYLLDSATSDDALGYHDRNLSGVPFGFVYLDLCAQLGDPWSATTGRQCEYTAAPGSCKSAWRFGARRRDVVAPGTSHPCRHVAFRLPGGGPYAPMRAGPLRLALQSRLTPACPVLSTKVFAPFGAGALAVAKQIATPAGQSTARVQGREPW